SGGAVVAFGGRPSCAMGHPRGDRGPERGERLEERDAARLLVPVTWIVDAVADVFAAAILARPRPQIRAVAALEIAPAVVLLGLVEDALDRPGFDLLQLVRRHGERVDRARVPRKRRIAALGAAGGDGVRAGPGGGRWGGAGARGGSPEVGWWRFLFCWGGGVFLFFFLF